MALPIIEGTANGETVSGTGVAEDIRAGAGSDTINAEGGDDVIFADGFEGFGGPNNDDVINGGDGNDTIYTFYGKDRISGGAGDDIIDTHYNNTGLIDGGTGTDTLSGAGDIRGLNLSSVENLASNGMVTLTVAQYRSFQKIEVTQLMLADAGTVDLSDMFISHGVTVQASDVGNTITGSDFNDLIIGGLGKDVLTGGDGRDVLNGGAGNDVLSGGAGDDDLRGGGGADIIDGGAGTNAVSYILAQSGIYMVFGDEGHWTGDAAGDQLTNISAIGGSIHDDTLGGGAGANLVFGDGGDDRLIGGAGDTLQGGDGNDTFVVDHVSVVVVETQFAAGSEADWVEANVTYQLADNVENLRLTGIAEEGKGNDTVNILYGNASANRLWGQGGNDTLDGGAGRDKMAGGAGDDTYYVDNSGDKIYEVLGGVDSGGYDIVWSSVSFTLSEGVEALYLTGSASEAFGSDGSDSLAGNEGSDRLWGNGGGDLLGGGVGADKMAGGAGDDVYLVDNIGDKVYEILDGKDSGGVDQVQAQVSYSLSAFVENLTLLFAAVEGFGNDLANILNGNSAGNKLWGNGGNDLLDGKSGADKMAGGAGDDTYVVDHKSDKVYEVLEGKNTGGRDTVQASLSYSLGDYVENLVLTGTAIEGFGNVKDNSLTGNEAANRLWGKGGDDILDGASGADKMAGGAGNDIYIVDNAGDAVYEILKGVDSGGKDEVRASVSFTLGEFVEKLTLTGVDNINGTGNDLKNTLTGNSGKNTLTGGLGADTFIFGAGSGKDIVTDFHAAEGDRLDLRACHAQSTAIITQSGAHTKIDLGGGNVITLNNVTATDAGFLSHIVW